MTIVATVFIVLVGLLAAGVWVGIALLATGAISLSIFHHTPVVELLAFQVWSSLNAHELVALPMFILMGEILYHSRLSRDLFDGLKPWLGRLPGGLAHINVMGCALFAAVSGSSAATTATVGRMTLGELKSRGYDNSLAMGSLAGAGTLGFLIPPSIVLILYGVLAEVSILDLFIAGIIPGALLTVFYMGYIALRALMDPSLTPAPDPATWADRLGGLKLFAPFIILVVMVLGSMYAGLASPTEASVIGVAGAFLVALWQKTLNPDTIKDALFGTIRTVSMIGLILTGALFLSKAMAFLGLPQMILEMVASLNLSPMGLILLLLVFFVGLGMVLDGLSLIVMALPIALPLVLAAGFDAIWFAIFLVIAVEMAQITPPVGFNLFVVQNLTGERMGTIAKSALPFFLILGFFAILLAIYPQIVTWLPEAL